MSYYPIVVDSSSYITLLLIIIIVRIRVHLLPDQPRAATHEETQDIRYKIKDDQNTWTIIHKTASKLIVYKIIKKICLLPLLSNSSNRKFILLFQ